MTPDDEEPTAEELEEAERLARALERGHAPGGVPEDALGAAALLRFSKDGGALEPERAERILEEALSRARPPVSKPRRRYTLLGLLGLAAAGAAAFLLVVKTQAPEAAALLPSPPRELLEAQLAAATAKDLDEQTAKNTALAALDDQTARYRGVLYATLRERYGR
ncbi:MAG TPA: hypothetical protein VH062_14160 [Polyangiaceae bacterium]|nr:hypothetical protein [Polyangiaceae bacterium]